MNNNRNNTNNRRRGRNNTGPRPQGGNGGGQVNRIDSRSRGNAPQMLEKYRKLAHDAHLNGDRVNAEYYLQFADHYFRVIADTRLRQEEARNRQDGRWQGEGGGERPGEENEDGVDFGNVSDFPSFDSPPAYTRAPREAQREAQREAPRETQRDDRPQNDRAHGERSARDHGETRDYQPQDYQPGDAGEADLAATAEAGAPAPNPYEPPVNPFVRGGGERESAAPRGLRPRREDRRPRRDGEGNREAAGAAPAPVLTGALDPTSLPPAISAARRGGDDADAGDDAAAAAKPAPKRRAPRRKPAADTGDLLDPVS